MTAPRDLAASLSARVLDRIEADRAINSANVAEAIFDGLVLRAAKDEPQRAADYREVLDETAALIRLMLNDLSLAAGMNGQVRTQIDKIYRALVATGWRP